MKKLARLPFFYVADTWVHLPFVSRNPQCHQRASAVIRRYSEALQRYSNVLQSMSKVRQMKPAVRLHFFHKFFSDTKLNPKFEYRNPK